MTQLYRDPPPPINLEPIIDDQPLSIWSLRDYVRLWVWIFYCPHMLTAYLKKHEQKGPNILILLLLQIIILATVMLFCIDLAVWWLLAPADAVNVIFVAFITGVALIILIMGVMTLNRAILANTDWPPFIIEHINFPILFGTVASVSIICWVHPSPFLSAAAWGVLFAVATSAIFLVESPLNQRTLQRFPWQASAALILFILALLPLETMPLLRFFLGTNARLLFMFLATSAAADAFLVTRPDSWLLSFDPATRRPAPDGRWHVPCVTTITCWTVEDVLTARIKTDWKAAIASADQLFRYSRQHEVVYTQLRKALKDAKGDDALEKVARMAEAMAPSSAQLRHDAWNLRYFTDSEPVTPPREPLSTQAKRTVKQLLYPPPPSSSPRITKPTLHHKPDTDSDSRAAIAGFWYLKQNYPDKAKEAFEKLGTADYGKEMIALSQALDTLISGKPMAGDKPPVLPQRPPNPRHKVSWEAIEDLHDVARLTSIFRASQIPPASSPSPSARAQAMTLAENRLEKIHGDRRQPQDRIKLNNIEGPLLQDIARIWEGELTTLKAQNPPQRKPKAVDNPFVYAEPVRSGDAFARRSVIQSIHNAWKVENFNNLYITGPRQSGKTTLFHGAARTAKSIIPAYVNLCELPPNATIPTLFLAICDAIDYQIGWRVPDRSEFYTDPYRACQRTIGEVCTMLGPSKKLLIALDEIEQLRFHAIPSDEVQHALFAMWELAQDYQNLGYVFISYYTLDEFRQLYESPFAAGLNPISVTYLLRDETRRLLQRPRRDFLPYFLDDATTTIFDLTEGQPFLVQLLAYCTVERFNRSVNATPPSQPIFTSQDVITVQRTYPLFLRQRTRYCENIRDELTAVAPFYGVTWPDLEKLLKALANTPGLPDANVTLSGLNPQCLPLLRNHKVIYKVGGLNYVRVELFRQWIK